MLSQKEDGHEFYLTVDASGRMDRCFVQLDGSLEEWALGGTQNVLLFDPTHGTNKYGLKLAAFVTVAPTGQTVILAICLFVHEDEDTFEWCFRSFARVFRVAPACFFTDGDVAMDKAYRNVERDVWAGCHHFLCVFHISKNVYKHLRPLFTEAKEWHTLFSLFWSIAKNSDVYFDDEFDDGFSKLVQMVEQRPSSSAQDKALSWLQSLKERKTKWAACFVWSHRTWGVFSTQRCEMMQAVMKSQVQSNFELIKLIPALIALNVRMRDLREVDDIRKCIKATFVADALPAVVKHIIGSPPRLTGFAADLLCAQAKQALSYRCSPLANDEFMVSRLPSMPAVTAEPMYDSTGFLTSFRCDADFGMAEVGDMDTSGRCTSLTDCSCQFLKAWGLPCRHIICVHIHKQMETFPFEKIGAKWFNVESHVVTAAVEHLIRQAPAARQVETGQATIEMTAQDRHSLAMASLRPLAELASLSNNNLAVVRMHALDVAGHIRNNGQSQLLHPGADAMTGSRDPSSLKSILGLLHQPAKCPSPDHLQFGAMAGQAYVGRFIAYKWADKGRGGWCFGVIKKQLFDAAEVMTAPGRSEAQANFEVHYACDDTDVASVLVEENYCSVASAVKHSWMLLEERDWSYVPEAVLNPDKPARKGRASSKRKRPFSGPTS